MISLRRVPTRTKPLSESDALYGAAFRVVFERVGNPDQCASGEQLAVLSRVVADVRAWAPSQAPDVARAYERAAVDVLERAKTVVENTRRALLMMALYGTIPKPPLPERKDKAA
jgi:hypothetical protein